MNYNKYPEEAKRRHPSLCFQCGKAVKPAAGFTIHCLAEEDYRLETSQEDTPTHLLQ